MKKIIIWVIVVIIVVAIGEGFWWWQNNNKSITDTSHTTENAEELVLKNVNEQENKIFDNKKLVPSQQNDNKIISYQTGKYTIFYELNNNPFAQKKVTVYLDDGNEKTELFQETAWSIGGSNPEFQEIKSNNIVLLTFTNGDMGWFQKNYHYVNVTNKEVISVEDIDVDAGLIKISNQKQDWEISTFIKNECKYFEDGKVKIRDGENSYLTDLTLNGKRVNVLTQERVLKCIDSDGLGTGLNPDVDLKYSGISKDLSKIFFSLTSTDGVEFAFDINNQTILESVPQDLVE
ncbi:MAG: hypothetical protein COV59_02195 [Candidatus Magasanikbacteria bacterium CG11_big_fil_rev_8_21_14_0_20_39_34]|uniref:Uncharacterized protein n=1 Tax=Candidatus Magasanikbacteria bacterium CG11_big_fil_rev_8_21_14_0_20_39_34 TaxID=1974653 RepID=A0A2H0N502_9BACT|nr:MAG: hypothetical protein COV59_02195 [Candidatus Magasanikbacteria bacterium CG11_big_fil_rev_8_21_14_0_20_39_34]